MHRSWIVSGSEKRKWKVSKAKILASTNNIPLLTRICSQTQPKEAVVKMMVVASTEVIMRVNTVMKVTIARMPRICLSMMVERMIT